MSKARLAITGGLALAIGAGVLIWLVTRPALLAGERRVGVFLYAQQPIIKEIDAGFRRQLDRDAEAKGLSITYVERNADGDSAQTTAIARYFKSADVDLVFVVGQPAAQALKTASVGQPVIFAGPPDPVGAGLVPRLTGHGTNFTGVMYFPNVRAIIRVFRTTYPQATRVAVIHSPVEVNSMAVTKTFLSEAKDQGLDVLNLGATNTAEMEAALRALSADRVDGLFIPNDSLMYSSLDRVMSQAKTLGLPVFSCTKLAVEKGAVFSVATDYGRIGELAGVMALRILADGQAVQATDVLDVQEGHLYVKKSDPAVGRIQALPGYDLVIIP